MTKLHVRFKTNFKSSSRSAAYCRFRLLLFFKFNFNFKYISFTLGTNSSLMDESCSSPINYIIPYNKTAKSVMFDIQSSLTCSHAHTLITMFKVIQIKGNPGGNIFPSTCHWHCSFDEWDVVYVSKDLALHKVITEIVLGCFSVKTEYNFRLLG